MNFGNIGKNIIDQREKVYDMHTCPTDQVILVLYGNVGNIGNVGIMGNFGKNGNIAYRERKVYDVHTCPTDHLDQVALELLVKIISKANFFFIDLLFITVPPPPPPHWQNNFLR